MYELSAAFNCVLKIDLLRSHRSHFHLRCLIAKLSRRNLTSLPPISFFPPHHRRKLLLRFCGSTWNCQRSHRPLRLWLRKYRYLGHKNRVYQSLRFQKLSRFLDLSLLQRRCRPFLRSWRQLTQEPNRLRGSRKSWNILRTKKGQWDFTVKCSTACQLVLKLLYNLDI